MPDANGQMYLSDFRTELQSRGFEGFSAADLNSMINRGYFYIARKFPWYWKQETAVIPYPSVGWVSVKDTNPLVTGFKNMRAVYLKGVPTPTSVTRMLAIDEKEAFDKFLQDLESGVTGTPSVYFIDEDQLYVLPMLSPVGLASIEVHFNKRPAALTADSQVCVTPVDLDEAVLMAALERCHKRALETNLAMAVQIELEEFFDDMRDLEGDREDDLQERVSPDNQWA